MRTSQIRLSGSILGVVIVLGTLPACGSGSSGPTCGDREVRLASALDQSPILQSRPDGAVPLAKLSGCDPDSGFISATRQYQAPLSSHDVLVFYRAAAKEQGWHDEGLTPSGGAACFARTVSDTTAYLSVDLGKGAGGAVYASAAPPTTSLYENTIYEVEIIAAYGQEVACSEPG
jgi:hypothetical protein